METPIIGQLLLQFFLILLNAFFACTEIAVISLNDAKIKKNAEAGDKKALVLVRLMKQPARFLATIQVGITFAGFLGSAFAADNFSDRLVAWLVGLGVGIPAATLDTIAVVAITLILSYFTLVLGELVPKRIAMKNPEPIAKAVARVIYAVSKIAAPLVWLLTASTNGLLRLLRINPNSTENHVTEEEIRMMVDLGEEKGAIAPEEGEMIDNILELSNSTADQIMTHRTDLVVLWLDDPPEEWEKVIRSTSYSRYPVCGEDIDDVVGILRARDFLSSLRDPGPADPRKLIRPAYLVPETARVDILLREMKRSRAHIAVVIDEYGGMSGIITMEDLVEEIVGEGGGGEPDIIQTDKNSWRVRGTVYIDDLSEETGIPFPKGDYDTLGGLIFAQMSSIPEDGTHPEVDVTGAHIYVEELAGRRVEWAQVSLSEAAGKKEKKD